MRAALVLVLALAGCSAAPPVVPGAPIQVREIARSGYCNTPGEAPRVRLLAGPQAVADWQAARGTGLTGDATLSRATFVVVEHGLRRTGGYGVTVSPDARLIDGRLVLEAAFSGPPAGSMQTQALSSPCLLLQLPEGRYRSVELRDASGAVRATGAYVEALNGPVPESVR